MFNALFLFPIGLHLRLEKKILEKRVEQALFINYVK